MPFDTSLRNTCIFLAIFILAFFPAPFQLLLKPLLYPLRLLTNEPYPFLKPSNLPTCACCPPLTCPQQPPPQPTPTMSGWFQKTLTLPAQSRGSYLITPTITKELPEIKNYKIGLLHLFIQHTSCALSLNENFDSDVRADMSDALDRIVPEESAPTPFKSSKKDVLYRHDAEGEDDMPAHVKSALVGVSVSVPIKEGRLDLGTWQGVWYLEFRRVKHARKVVATVQGERY